MSDYTDLQQRAVRLLGHAALNEIKLFRLNASHRHFAQDGEQPHLSDLQVRLEANVQGADRLAYVVVVQTRLVQSLEGEQERELAEFEVAYGALYDLDGGAGAVEEDEAKAFGFAVATMAVWPFIRASIANVIADMNFVDSARLIPTITQRELAEAAAGAQDLDASTAG